MKGLDTGVLLEILRGETRAKELLRRESTDELATTELNMFELGVLAHQAPKHLVRRRKAALERLRRKLTILPMTEAAGELAGELLGTSHSRHPVNAVLMMSIFATHGGSEWITDRHADFPRLPGKSKLQRFSVR